MTGTMAPGARAVRYHGRVEFRFAATADAGRLVELINRAFIVERFFIEADRLDLAEVQERLLSGRFLILEDGGRLLACAYVESNGSR